MGSLKKYMSIKIIFYVKIMFAETWYQMIDFYFNFEDTGFDQ